MAEEKKKTGRPLTEIDKADFENLLEIGADAEQVRAWFARKTKTPTLNHTTIYRFCIREYGVSFAQLAAERKQICKTRVMMDFYKKCPHSDTLLIFAMKNICGWRSDPVHTDTETLERARQLLSALDTVIGDKSRVADKKTSGVPEEL